MRQAMMLLLVSLSLPISANAQDPRAFHAKELADYYKGSLRLGPNLARARTIYDQLRNDSGMEFRVIPCQTFSAGQAHDGGIILIDISLLQKPTPIVAFFLSHEWGHEALGHSPNIYRPNANAWRIRYSATQDEDEADEYAANFMAQHHYALDPVIAYLRRIPYSRGDFTHSWGPARAQHVQSVYQNALAQDPTGNQEPGSDKPVDCDEAFADCRREAGRELNELARTHLEEIKSLGCPCNNLVGLAFFNCREECNTRMAEMEIERDTFWQSKLDECKADRRRCQNK